MGVIPLGLGWDGIFLWEWDGRGLKIHSRVTLYPVEPGLNQLLPSTENIVSDLISIWFMSVRGEAGSYYSVGWVSGRREEGGLVESRIGSRLTGDDGLVGVLRVHEVGSFGVRWAVWRRVGWDAAGRAVASSGAHVRRVEGVGAVRVERRVQGAVAVGVVCVMGCLDAVCVVQRAGSEDADRVVCRNAG